MTTSGQPDRAPLQAVAPGGPKRMREIAWAAVILAATAVAGCGRGAPSTEEPVVTTPNEAPHSSTSSAAAASNETPTLPTPTPAAVAAKEPPGWCGRITIPPLTDAEKGDLIDKFRARNPGASIGSGEGSSLFSSAGHFISFSRFSAPIGNPVAPATAVAAERKALELVRKNSDLLGFTAAQLRGAKVATTAAPPDALLGWKWKVSLSGSVPRTGYEAFPSVATQIRIEVSIGEDGAMSLSNASEVLPPFKLCTAAPLSPKSPSIVRAILGYELGYFNIAGGHVSAGTVEAQDLGVPEKTIFLEYANGPHGVTLNLAYAVTVHKGFLTWTAYVDASSGRLLVMQANFVT